jgi:DNA polymerase-3 subunit beta
MRLTINRQAFLKALTFVNQAIPSKSAESQFMNYLIECNDNNVSIIGSDGDISTKVSIGRKNAEGEDVIFDLQTGLVQTPAKYLLDIVSKLGGNVITLNMVDTNYLNISDDVSTFNLITQPGIEYPNVDLNVPESKNGFKVTFEELRSLYETTAFAVASKGPKELFTGINVKAHDGKLCFLATDSFRMAKYAVPEEDQDAEFSFTSPVKALAMACKISETGSIEIYFDEQRAIFVSENVVLSTRLIKGEFPSIDKIIPNSFPYQVKVSTSEFLSAADRVKIISSAEGKIAQVRLTLSKETGVTLSSKSTNYGDSQEVLKTAVLTLPEEENIFEIGFNIDYIIDAVKALKSDEFTFVFASAIRMFMVTNDDKENVQILTPIRLSR